MNRNEKLAIRQRGGARKVTIEDELVLMDSPKSTTVSERVSSTKKSKKTLVDSLRAAKNLVNTSKDFLDTPTKKFQNSSGNSSRRSSSIRKNKAVALDRFSIKPKEFIDDDFKDISSVFEDSDISFSVDANKDAKQKKHLSKKRSANILESLETESNKSIDKQQTKPKAFKSPKKRYQAKSLDERNYSDSQTVPRKRRATQQRNEISNSTPEKQATIEKESHSPSISSSHAEISTPQRRSKRIQTMKENDKNRSSVVYSEIKANNNKTRKISDKQAFTSSLDEMLDISDESDDSDFKVIDEQNENVNEKKDNSKTTKKKEQPVFSTERLKTDKQVKLNALDITISNVVEFLKNYITENPEANKFQIIEKYLNVVYVYLLNLLDSNLLVLSLNSGLRSLNQRKLNLRHQIVELQLKNSKIVDHELVLLRNNNVKLFNFENNMSQLAKNLADLRKKKLASDATKSNEINGLLFKLNGVVDPGWPIIKKLENLNEVLKNLDSNLSEQLSKNQKISG